MTAVAIASLVAAAVTLATPGPATRPSTTSEWREVGAGVEHRRGRLDGARVEALRLDPARWRPRVMLATELDLRAAAARGFARSVGAPIAINGGFFNPELRPVGLRVSGGERIAGATSRQLGAFVVRDDGHRVVMGTESEVLDGALEVVQCGPRLVVEGRPNGLKPQVARRSVIGVEAGGRLVVMVTGAVDAPALAALLARPEADGGYGLEEALNLDGGPSTQLHVDLSGLQLDVAGGTPVADALVFVPREVEAARE